MKQIILTVIAIMTYGMVNAQSWQWGKRGGGGFNELSAGAAYEQVTDMSTDKNGNVYVLSQLRFDQNDVNVDGHPLIGYGYDDIVFSSFKCDGSYRWSKVIGTGGADIAVALKTDTLDGVYVAGIVRNRFQTSHFSSDTTITNSDKSLFLIKYDTAGSYKWLRRPQADTVGYWTSLQLVYSLDMDIDNAGNTYILCNLSNGLYGGSYSVTSEGLHVLKYDKNGVFLGGIPMAMTWDINNPYLLPLNMKRNQANGKFIITGSAFTNSPAPMHFGTTLLTGSMVVGSFNTNGSFDWVKQSSQYVNGELRKPDIDAAGNIYLAGRASTGDNFGGVPLNNADPNGIFPLLFKLDANGNTVWYKVAVTAKGLGEAAALLSNGEVVIGGFWGDVFKWSIGGDSLVHPVGVNYGTDPFITRFNATTGAFIKMDTLGSGPGSYDDEEITRMIGDRKGNLYIGGMFANKLKVAGTTLQAVSGGDRDMFIAKYGFANCSCTVPTSTFASTTTAPKTVQFTYSGTTASIDSLVWAFGDGQKQKVTSNYTAAISHTYATNGNYSSCATVYSGCGSNQYCKQVALAVGSISAMEGVKVYPNPTSDYLTIEGAEGATAMLMNSIGQHVANVILNSSKQSVNLSDLSSGIYILILQDRNGMKGTMRITKQ